MAREAGSDHQQEAAKSVSGVKPAPTSPARLPPVEIVLLSLWFGFFTGLGEVVLLGTKKALGNPFLGFGPDVIWTSPLVEMVLFGALGLVLALLAKPWPALARVKTVVAAFAFLSLASFLLLMLFAVNMYAKLLLAAGLASVLGGIAASRPRLLYRIVRFTMGWARSPSNRRASAEEGVAFDPGQQPRLDRRSFVASQGLALAGLAGGVHGWDWLREERISRSLPAAAGSPPNVLLIVLDTVRSTSLSMLGHDRPTSPRLERIARSGVSFERAFSTSPWTTPSHASMFTGRFPHELSTDWEVPLDGTFPTLAEVLSDHGYATAGFVANTERCSYESGLHRGFAHYEDYEVSAGQVIRTSPVRLVVDRVRERAGDFQMLGRKGAEGLSRDFLSWHSRRDDRRPYFAFLNYYDAHDPYIPPEEYAARFSPVLHTVIYSDPGAFPDVPRGHIALGDRYTEEQFRHLRDAYDGCIAYLDEQIGLLIAELERRGDLENTIVIITSDHGEQFGAHGLPGHANSLYLQTVHVPLLILYPARAPRATRIDLPASLRDLANTVLDLAGIEDTPFPGESLVRYWAPGESSRTAGAPPLLAEVSKGLRVPDWYPTAKGDMQALIAGDHHLIVNGDGREELYNYVLDPFEQTDLVDTPDGNRTTAELRAALAALAGEKA